MSMIGEVHAGVVKREGKHRCDLCGDPFVIGQEFLEWRWKEDGRVSTVKVHQGCDEEAAELPWYADGDGWGTLYPLKDHRTEVARAALRATPPERSHTVHD